MKKAILLFFAFSIVCVSPSNCQVGKFLNKVSNSVANKISGDDSKNAKQDPEPSCACDQPELVLNLDGNLKLTYSEISISVRDDGALLVKDRISGDYYIAKDGTTQGPIKAGDKRLSGFDTKTDEQSDGKKTWTNNEYISKSDDKFTIKFGGKSYGPYSQISEFKVARSKDKFAAIVVENEVVSEAEGKKMEAAIKNAKSDQERMELSMKYSQMMMQKMQDGGGPNSMMPTLVTNIPNVTYDPLKSTGGQLSNTVKFDDILFTTYDKVIDLSNKVLLNLKPDAAGAEALFVNKSNTAYAWYKYGTLTFSDGKTMTDLFSPHLVKINGQVSLAYLYYSPKRNAIMQCKIPF